MPGCVRNGVPETVANQIYDEMISFASYAFNKSHAAAYGVVAMQTAWLKRYYPVQFMAAMINSVYGNVSKIAGYIQYCRGRNIPVLPPDVNRGRWKFTVGKAESGEAGILFGLGAVKGVGENAVREIIREREAGGAFRDILDFCRRIDPGECNKRVVESLIKVGAFDALGANRPQMLSVYEGAMDANQSSRKKNVSGQVSLFDFLGEEAGEPLLQVRQDLPELPDCPAQMKLQMEKEAAGVYMTGHPLDAYREEMRQMTFTAGQLDNLEELPDRGETLDGQAAVMGGILTEVKGKATRKGEYMAFVTLEDLTGQIECLVFPRVYERYQAFLQEDAAVVMTGKLSVREEEAPKLLADRIVPLEEWKKERQGTAAAAAEPKPAGETETQRASRAKRKLYLRLNREQMDGAAAALALHPGPVPVYLHLPAEKLTLLTPESHWCSGETDCLERLRGMLGAENVVLREA